MKKKIINKNNISSFYTSLKKELDVYGVKEKEEGFYVFDETCELSLANYRADQILHLTHYYPPNVFKNRSIS